MNCELYELYLNYKENKINKKKFLESIRDFCILNNIKNINIDSKKYDDYYIKVIFSGCLKIEISDKDNNCYTLEVYDSFDLGSNDLYLRVETLSGKIKLETTNKLNNSTFYKENINIDEKIKLSYEKTSSNLDDFSKYSIININKDNSRCEKSYKINTNDLDTCCKINSFLLNRSFYQEDNEYTYCFEDKDKLLNGVFTTSYKYLAKCLSPFVASFVTDDFGELETYVLKGVTSKNRHILKILASVDENIIIYNIDEKLCFYYETHDKIENVFSIIKNKYSNDFIDSCMYEIKYFEQIKKENDLFFDTRLSPISYAKDKDIFIRNICDNLDTILLEKDENNSKNLIKK